MAIFSRLRRRGVTCSGCGYSVSALSEDIPGKLNPDGTCPICNKTIIPMDEGYYYCDNCCKTHSLTSLGRFKCSCGSGFR